MKSEFIVQDWSRNKIRRAIISSKHHYVLQLNSHTEETLLGPFQHILLSSTFIISYFFLHLKISWYFTKVFRIVVGDEVVYKAHFSYFPKWYFRYLDL